MHSRFGLHYCALLCACALAVTVPLQAASSATQEQLKEKCKQALMPRLRACVMAKLGGIPPRMPGGGALELAKHECGMAMVRPCVIREEQKEAAHVAPPAPPKAAISEASKDAGPIEPAFVPPPRTIADITAILDSEKPDEAKIAERKAKADASPPSGATPAELAQFYYDRASSRALLARNKDALDDGLRALALKTGPIPRLRQLIGLQYRALGESNQAIAIYQDQVRDAEQPGKRGSAINALFSIAQTLAAAGDLEQAIAYAHRVEAFVQEARGSPSPQWRKAYVTYGNYWESEADGARGIVFEVHGQYAEAEAAYRRAEAFHRAALKDLANYASPPPEEMILYGADIDVLLIARVEAKQSRLSEAEADARRALLEILQQHGKYNPATPRFIFGLAGVLVEQGRYAEAEKLARAALDVQRTLGIGDNAPQSARILSQLGNVLLLQGKTDGANSVYQRLDQAIAQWPAARREALRLNGSRIVALYAAGQIANGIAAAEELLKREVDRTGAGGVRAAGARSLLAIGYARAGRDAEAVREFAAAVPILMSGAGERAADNDPTLVAARSERLQRVIEAYIDVLARSPGASSDVAAQTFGLADAVRGHAVQQALADSSARAAAKDPALAELVRTEQDRTKEIGAALGALNNLLASPSDQRGDQKVRAINAAVEKLRADRKTAQQEIKRRFPSYADLVNPKPPSVDEIKGALRPGEALVSFYFGRDESFVWAVPKEGAVVFAALPTTAADLDAKVHTLRQALEPEVASINEIPPFDLDLAYNLYSLLLKPIEAGWQSSNSLIVVTNGALGELPLALLPTAPSSIDPQAKPLFAGYRGVPWLARSRAVTVIPSASALLTLRHLPAGSASRDKFIGFGDPYFSVQEASDAEASATPSAAQIATLTEADADAAVTRGMPLRLRASPHTEDIDVAELAMLPRLPDTRLELIAIAKALDVDPAKALFLGKDANEQNVETADLAHHRIIAFATHGLVPGDIDGLTQPALALTAPEVAGVKGNGLLTMDKILALKLDADWVVLSACNTAAGSGAGAEAASGLGSAFFYAGTRALLVTNWSVQSDSARELTTDIFRRQSADPTLSRSEALRQAMMALLDGPGAVDAQGNTTYTYGHPLFWAPYSVIGDGGGH